ECESRRPFCVASADFAFGSSLLFASDTPLASDSHPATIQITSSTTSPAMPSPMRSPQRGPRFVPGAPGPRYSARDESPRPASDALRTRDLLTVGTFPFLRP